jgi:hypothetical protein
MNETDENQTISVEMVTPKGGTPTRNYQYEIQHFARLGKEIKISPKANISVNKPGFKTEFFVETVTAVIGIGKDHTADLVMSKAAWDALNAGENVNIMTTEDFKRKFVYPKK